MSHISRFGARAGMTLVEVLAVVVILGLIATTVTVAVSGSMGEAKHQIAISQIARLERRLDTYKLKKHRYPTSGEGLAVLTADPKAPWYVEPAQLNDPWGRPYAYVVPGPDGHYYEIVSYGADGMAGGTGEDADLSSIGQADNDLQ
ncbi:MAG: type II secretion system major pseudopilin GspG [Planctomycetota bacterium]